MATIADIEQGVLNRLEDSPTVPVFWDLTNEIRPIIVEGLCEMSLLCGEPEVRTGAFTLTANTTFFSLPANALGIVRMEGPNDLEINKVSMFDLDMDNLSWQNAAKQNSPNSWFPLGMTQFGIYPQVTADIEVILTVLQFPVLTDPPYQGTEAIPFTSEFFSGFEAYGEHIARLKEGSPEFDQSMPLYEYFLSVAEEMSKFAIRKGELRFSRLMGASANMNDIERR